MASCLANDKANGDYQISENKRSHEKNRSFDILIRNRKLRMECRIRPRLKMLLLHVLVLIVLCLANWVNALSLTSKHGKPLHKFFERNSPKVQIPNILKLKASKLDVDKIDHPITRVVGNIQDPNSIRVKICIDGNATDSVWTDEVVKATKICKKDAMKNGKKDPSKNEEAPSTRSLWRRRHARSITEGIRRERSKTKKLSSLLQKARQDTIDANRQFLRSAITGFISAVAEKSEGLSVKVKSRKGTPFWEKHIDSIEIAFSRLDFRPIRIGGIDTGKMSSGKNTGSSQEVILPLNKKMSDALNTTDVDCMIEAFRRIDSDNSGTLDRDEIAEALESVTYSNSDWNLLAELAAELVDLYDANGDGVVDFDEYKLMVEHMADLRDKQQKMIEEETKTKPVDEESRKRRWFSFGKRKDGNNNKEIEAIDNSTHTCNSSAINADSDIIAPVRSSTGAITITDLKLDLRRLFFGGVPGIKKITPGGPLVLEPFTANIKGSFNDEDVLFSFLVNKGLRLLAARAIRRRVRSLRDIIDGAHFFGRSWNMASVQAPVVEVPQITEVEFDKRNRLIVTGRAKVRTSPDAPEIEQAFKLRTKLGTRKNGQAIRLEQPELALVIECPKGWERNIVTTCRKFNLTVPTKPDPLYSFFPIYSPFKLEDGDGFDMGPDNRLKSLEIRDGALHFEMRAILRPGRFLGSHYVAFTLPMRTFLITLERVVGAIRTARKNKGEAKARAKLALKSQEGSGEVGTADKRAPGESGKPDLSFKDTTKENNFLQPRPQKNFFSRFIEGYQDAGKEDEVQSERITNAISEWFGRQGRSNENE
mmetsp:Transcript_19898/g.29513  ORF Transcript_19898/g.29513 Transcript_19898/m.29513 type:complete len:820 (+) Transcript_19898:212-2671(+)|eukprot:CAMPEP_0194200442 /NCGR_PEP_ID=MMETSP0156-20130528/1042_1 /TAXON_ID=33649 /ORGANISM="Thalassionema nitzschioides, Strain L26-B" /LENGTH=819 /DNA_ID=CAMNT_0038925437 /DNA_START=190 /DNA_END=2649 /DNA_ORIENTATION=-